MGPNENRLLSATRPSPASTRESAEAAAATPVPHRARGNNHPKLQQGLCQASRTVCWVQERPIVALEHVLRRMQGGVAEINGYGEGQD